MAYNGFDPFFDNENDNKNQEPTQNPPNEYKKPLEPAETSNIFFSENNNNNAFSNNSINNTPENNNNNNQGYQSSNPPYNKKKKPVGLGILLIILLPLLLITNVITSVFVFNFAWQDAHTSLKAELNTLIDKENNLPVDSQFLAYNISKEHLPSVLEITAVGGTGASSGTGFILTDTGYFLTNAHVVTYQKSTFQGMGTINKETAVSEKITVAFADNETAYSVSVIAYDTNLDLAVCKFDTAPANLQPVTFADSTLLSYGEPCIAIGNAQGYGLATTEGVISAPIQYYNLSSRDNALTSAVQHSAAINPGNSGGPLFNIYGQVVGINSFKLTGNSELAIDGMGFAIPSAVAKDYINGLKIEGLNIQYSTTPTIG